MKLKKINLRKGKEHSHPDIVVGRRWYLARIESGWFVGRFGKEWYGLNFETGEGTGIQFDTPGYNSSGWKELYELPSKSTRSKKGVDKPVQTR